MLQITLEQIAGLFQAELDPIKTEIASIKVQLDAVQEMQAQHTGALAQLSTDLKSVIDQKTVGDYRLERLEHWAKSVSNKVGVTIDL